MTSASAERQARLDAARREAALGLPVVAGERRALAKRVLAKLSWPFLRHQVVVNAVLLDHLRELQADSDALAVRCAELQARLDAVDSALGVESSRLGDRLGAVESAVGALAGATPRLDALEEALGGVGRGLEGLAAQTELLEAARVAVEDRITRVLEIIGQIEETLTHHHGVLVRHEETLEQLDGRFAAVHEQIALLVDRIELVAMQAFSRHHDGVSSIQAQLAEVAAYVDDSLARFQSGEIERVEQLTQASSSRTTELFESLTSQLAVMTSELDDARRAGGSQYDSLRSSLSRDLTQLQRSVREVRLRLASIDVALSGVTVPRPGLSSVSAASSSVTEGARIAGSSFARLYEGFTEAVAPSRPERVLAAELYLADLQEVAPLGPVLDLRCGDGWLLSQLRDVGVEAYGVDLRAHLVEVARRRGVDARVERPAEHLAGCAKDLLGAVTMLDVVEYLEIDELVQLIDLSLLALAPGGALVVEALDPDNLVVAASVFPQDPLRKHLVPKQLLAYLVEARGFRPGELRSSSLNELAMPDPERTPWSVDLAPLVEAINERLLGPHRYVLVARRS